jgi:precorrin-6B methylase 2
MWLYYFFKTKLFEWREQKEVESRFYRSLNFEAKDLELKQAYKNENPYRISKLFLKKRGAKDVHQYGETPLTTLALVVEHAKITPKDTVIEMGAGRGRGALFFAEYIGCKVIAYEQIPEFIEKSVYSPRIQWKQSDMLDADFSGATAVFLYGTMLEDEKIEKLAKKIPAGIKVITVSYPLNLYSENFQTITTFQGRFPWGETEIFISERISQEKMCALHERDPAHQGSPAP